MSFPTGSQEALQLSQKALKDLGVGRREGVPALLELPGIHKSLYSHQIQVDF